MGKGAALFPILAEVCISDAQSVIPTHAHMPSQRGGQNANRRGEGRVGAVASGVSNNPEIQKALRLGNASLPNQAK